MGNIIKEKQSAYLVVTVMSLSWDGDGEKEKEEKEKVIGGVMAMHLIKNKRRKKRNKETKKIRCG